MNTQFINTDWIPASDIIDVVRAAGSNGITTQEMADVLSVRNYQLRKPLKFLYRRGLLHKELTTGRRVGRVNRWRLVTEDTEPDGR